MEKLQTKKKLLIIRRMQEDTLSLYHCRMTQNGMLGWAKPGVPSPENMASAMFPPEGVVVSTMVHVPPRDHLNAVSDKIISTFVVTYRLAAIVHSGRRNTWKDLDNNEGRDMDGQDIPREILYQTSRSWYVICERCKLRGKFSVLAECFFLNSPTGCKNAQVRRVYFHDSHCNEERIMYHANNCRRIKFPFDNIFGSAYEHVKRSVNNIGSLNGAENRDCMLLKAEEIGVDEITHNQCIWRLLYFHVSVNNMSKEVATCIPFFSGKDIRERINEMGHLTVDGVVVVFSERGVKSWQSTNECNHSSGVAQSTDIGLAAGYSRDTRGEMTERGDYPNFMPGVIVVPIEEIANTVNELPKENYPQIIQKGWYQSFDNDSVYGSVYEKTRFKETYPAICINLVSMSVIRSQDGPGVCTAERSIHMSSEKLESFMNAMVHRSKEMMEIVHCAGRQFIAFQDTLRLPQNGGTSGQSRIQSHTHNLRSTRREIGGTDVSTTQDDVATNGNDGSNEACDSVVPNQHSGPCLNTNTEDMPKLQSMLYKTYQDLLDTTNAIAGIIKSLGKPNSILDMESTQSKALYTRAARTKGARGMRGMVGANTPWEAAATMVLLHHEGADLQLGDARPSIMDAANATPVRDSNDDKVTRGRKRKNSDNGAVEEEIDKGGDPVQDDGNTGTETEEEEDPTYL